jgi:hypothetical protein
MVLMLPFLGYSLLSYVAFEVRTRPTHHPHFALLALVDFLGILEYWVLRNIPRYPFSLVAP